MSLLLPDSGLLFWMLLSFGVVFVVLAKYGFPVTSDMKEPPLRTSCGGGSFVLRSAPER